MSITCDVCGADADVCIMGGALNRGAVNDRCMIHALDGFEEDYELTVKPLTKEARAVWEIICNRLVEAIKKPPVLPGG